MIFTKDHLQEKGYEWNLGNNIRASKDMAPSRNRFDRFNGNCILRMLNLFDQLIVSLSVPDAQHLESLISRELPLELSSEVSVFNWLKRMYIYTSPLNKSTDAFS